MEHYSLAQLSKALHNREFSSVELTQHCINKIQSNKDLNAFISLDEDQALKEAQSADLILKNGEGKPLTGIPMALKDLFCTKRLNTTCASKMLANFQAPYDATIVTKFKQNGAIIIGKTNMDEFAMGSSNENSYFGSVKNPWDRERVPGGSSGGSAAAVAGNLVPFAIGSDTGGSIRQPAAFCGISGIKPTYGLVSRYGMVAFASSLDQAGPFAKSAEDLAMILHCMAGFDSKDSTSVDRVIPDYSAEIKKSVGKIRIGLPSCFFQPQVEKGIQDAIHDAVKLFESLGAEIIEIDLKLQPLWVPCYYVIACAEASSNLSRYDGIRFGHRSKSASTLIELITNSRSEGFGNEVKRRILTGTHVLSSGFFDAYYLHAQKVRRLIRDELITTLNSVDVILGPTTPTTAFKLGEKIDDPIQNYLADVFTVAANLAGLPAISIPTGFENKLPIGLQLMGKHFSENRLLAIAHHYQQHTNWHLANPNKQG
ncbi:Glutamyl-tRNA(Gln) amidotransferase subunit A [Legionella pneumophila]|uniref:Asp-tRNA(Asn)/Glu-tRNA(Gln) amidotransferase subunit GatA n=1 Tax=Legionella pneumophila TaxID=446 RepID=UPI0005CA10F2|nr:Asp-tRNA(Asn)/Glu-tRNA(Gln) amidotransferase subunit GatA [Legionella pneumophila]HAT8828128.1 Asp-tRNA(Asn)/Glu-tRNA(Gln) amidotransferase subunit GatA [Legionella pneumophila subsp. pneumophila]WAI77924.1 Asp-tRNA(Asn)/Glu-tRNA(Gln) amidotransferase subunit GatA [Legionella pneumophila]CZG97871.1 Glutamyl-tRNA(Gln) amidotransferase subunit A [Legionella pneumophila]CZI18904.1 Glutamyl-tRNA(Gln) amidotransferase subunit A [Legionella pneumophila]HAT4693143.1 Asp-tRNA(Asn)/Glu-tRNA(Gln) ami